jgi:hypothetical protein
MAPRKKSSSTTQETEDARALVALEARISKLDDKVRAGQKNRRPDLLATRERVRLALAAKGSAQDETHLGCAHRLLEHVFSAEAHGFGPDPESQLLFLADAVDELAVVVRELRAIEVTP